jgi:hypothetical protein
MKFRRTGEIAHAVALRMWRADTAGHPIQADEIFDAARATHGHAVAMAAWDKFDWLRRVADEDAYHQPANNDAEPLEPDDPQLVQ